MRTAKALAVVAVLVASAGCGGDEPTSEQLPSSPESTSPLDDASDVGREPTTSAGVESTTAGTTSTSTTGAADGPALCELPMSSGLSEIECEGMTFHVAVPADCRQSSCGVIVDAHPTGMSWEDEERGTNMQQLGTDAGYIVVQPQSPLSFWNYSVDAGRIRRFIERLGNTFDVDQDRIHVGGASGGGYLAWTFVCEHADLIASAAPLAAGATTAKDQSCDFDETGSPLEEVDILLIHGRNDAVVPFDTAITQRDLVVAAWDMAESQILADEPTYRWTQWTSPEGTVFEFIEHDWENPAWYRGHCGPGAPTADGGCGVDNPIHYGETALEFYLAHPKHQ